MNPPRWQCVYCGAMTQAHSREDAEYNLNGFQRCRNYRHYPKRCVALHKTPNLPPMGAPLDHATRNP